MASLVAARAFVRCDAVWEIVATQDEEHLTYEQVPSYDADEICDELIPTNHVSAVKRSPVNATHVHASLTWHVSAVECLFSEWLTKCGLNPLFRVLAPSGVIIMPLRRCFATIGVTQHFHGTSPHALPLIVRGGCMLRPLPTCAAGSTRLEAGPLLWSSKVPSNAWRYAAGVDLGHLVNRSPCGWFVQVVATFTVTSDLSGFQGVSAFYDEAPVFQFLFKVSSASHFTGAYLLPAIPLGLLPPV